MDSIRIDTGVKCISIERDGGVRGEIEFNPSDVNFAEKFQRMYARLQEKQDEFHEKSLAIDANQNVDKAGMPENAAERVAFLREVGEFVRAEIDSLFGEGTSQIVFGDYVPLDPSVYGQFLDGISPHVELARSEKMDKYLSDPDAALADVRKKNKRGKR